MKTKSIKIAVAAALLIPFGLFSQTENIKENGRFDIEIDPTAYILKGYSFHAGYTKGISRFDLAAVGLEFPENYNGNKGITARSNGAGIKWDYINEQLKGFYFGPQADFYQLKLTVKGNSSADITSGMNQTKLNQVNLGVRVGYRMMFGAKKGDLKYIFNKKAPVDKGFYLNIWCAAIYNPTARNKAIANLFYKIPSSFLFPTVHLGWKF